MRKRECSDDLLQLLMRLSIQVVDVLSYLDELEWTPERFEVALKRARGKGITVRRHAGNAISVSMGCRRLAEELIAEMTDDVPTIRPATEDEPSPAPVGNPCLSGWPASDSRNN